MPFLSLSCLIALARNSNTILSKSGKNRHPCLVPDFRSITLTKLFTTKCDINGFDMYDLYHVEAHSFRIHFIENFYHKLMLDLVKYFFCIYRDDHMVFILHFVNAVCHINWFEPLILNHSCIYGLSPAWSWCVILLMYCLICFANNFVEDFFIYINQRYWTPIFSLSLSLFFFLHCLCLVLV